MNTDLDTRARDAARHLRTLVGDARLELSQPEGRHFRSASRYPVWAAGVGILIAAVALLWLFDPLPNIEPAQDPVPTSTVTATTSGPDAVVPTSTPPAMAPPAPEGTFPDTTPPALVILHPVNEQIFETTEVIFEGTTEMGARVFAGPYQAAVGDDGGWRIVLFLSEGENVVAFTARDAAGNVSEASVRVVYKPSPPETTTTKPELAAFDANFTFGVCNINPPFDEYYGVGQPGSLVSVGSEYGSGSTVVGESGEWFFKVEFPTAPSGQTFLVTVSDEFGRKEVFEFTSTVPPG